jgi:hypothetical protein
MRDCLYCQTPLGAGIPPAPTPGRRHAYDPWKGRLWEICPHCLRWNPVPLELRWETLEGWEAAVRDRGTVLLQGPDLALLTVGEGEVVRVGSPPLGVWGGWRYGTQLPDLPPPRLPFWRRWLGQLPPPPLEGYDPYGFTGPLGGVAGTRGPSRWLGSPFLRQARALTVVFHAIPLAPECPNCGDPLPILPWEFEALTFVETRAVEGIGIEATCGACRAQGLVSLGEVRPALRLGLAVIDADRSVREVGQEAGGILEAAGGGPVLLRRLGEGGIPVGDLSRPERVALGIALDQEAEAEALEAEWREAEEIAAILDGELSDVPGFQEFQRRILENDGS